MERNTSIQVPTKTRRDLKILAAEIDKPQGETIDALITLRRRLQSLASIAESTGDRLITIAEIHAILKI